MVVEGGTVPDDVLAAEEKAKNHVAPHVNFYDPSAYMVSLPRDNVADIAPSVVDLMNFLFCKKHLSEEVS